MNSPTSQCRIGDAIKAEALRLGFDAVGFAQAAPVSAQAAQAFTRWIATGKHDCMQWATNHTDLRLDPTLLVPGARSVISLAVNYLPPRLQPAHAPQVARYAYGDDYHEVLRDMGRQLAAFIKEHTGHDSRICVDSAPILERYWAQQAGLGFTGLNTLLIIPGRGSHFFLCELVTTLALEPDAPCTLTCGDCHACERHCPGGALSGGTLDAARCLSCQTIENRAAQLPEWVASAIGGRLYGCDECQRCCPHNAQAQPTTHPAFQGRESILHLTLPQVLEMTQEQFSTTFRHSPIKRAKLTGLHRNAQLLKK
ncbi:MAG: tRNA epoxyqueuosine(34) reductase QueG [Bacteroidales bacterium]|nr:tRNA epoxyqueuosine(34) reductase QueG [Bacteroidales bacterium]